MAAWDLLALFRLGETPGARQRMGENVTGVRRI